MAGRKSDFTLPTLDDLFSTQEMRDDAKLAKIRDIPLELIDDFPDHPFKVRDDEDMLGGCIGVVFMCCLQINRLYKTDSMKKEVEANEKKNC